MSDTFSFCGDDLAYTHFPSPPYWDWLDNSERVVEVSIGKHLMALWRTTHEIAPSNILEFGNVIPQYVGYNDHVVLDKGDWGFGAITDDIVNYAPNRTFDLIFSLSTLEHVGFDEGTPDAEVDDTKPHRALKRLLDLRSPTGVVVVEWPIGWNKALDADWAAGNVPLNAMTYLRRVDAANHWDEASWEKVKDAKFGEPFPSANALVVAWSGG